VPYHTLLTALKLVIKYKDKIWKYQTTENLPGQRVKDTRPR